jgi:hypothetical protein
MGGVERAAAGHLVGGPATPNALSDIKKGDRSRPKTKEVSGAADNRPTLQKPCTERANKKGGRSRPQIRSTARGGACDRTACWSTQKSANSPVLLRSLFVLFADMCELVEKHLPTEHWRCKAWDAGRGSSVRHLKSDSSFWAAFLHVAVRADRRGRGRKGRRRQSRWSQPGKPRNRALEYPSSPSVMALITGSVQLEFDCETRARKPQMPLAPRALFQFSSLGPTLMCSSHSQYSPAAPTMPAARANQPFRVAAMK